MKIKKNDLIFLLLCVYISFLFAFYRCKYGDFVAYNGDFQNYNIFRRMLSGQVQYRDFVNYLGAGCTIINLPLIAIFRSFGASVFITNFTACAAFCFIIYVASYVMTSNKNKSYIITLILAFGAFCLLKGYKGSEFYYKYISNVAFIAELGHSMRTVRGMLPYILVAIFYLYKKKHPDFTVKVLITDYKKLAITSLLMGAFVLWSNDFGFANVICYIIIVFLIENFGLKKKLKEQCKVYLVILLSIIVGFFVTLFVITKGSMLSYIKTTASIASYQFWYYQNMPGKYCTIFDYFKDSIFSFMTIVFCVYAFSFLYNLIYKKPTDKEIIRLFLLSTNYAASIVYVYGSGHHNYYMLQLIVYISVADTIFNFIKNRLFYFKNNRYKIVDKICLGMIVVLIFFSSEIVLKEDEMLYSEKINVLNVNSTIGQRLNEKASKYKGIFSTYATAVETINGEFQPTGIDYIIHVLGDDARERYIDNFINGNYQYASTLKNDYTTWEYWAIRANWFFYRELYKNYNPIDQTNYSIVWEKSEKQNTLDIETEVNIEKVNESTSVICVKTPGYRDGVYVDLKISYNTEWTKERLSNLALRKCISVADGGEKYNYYNANSCYYIKEKTDGYYIPVYVIDGEARIAITSNPVSCTKLVNLTASVENVIETPKYDLNLAYYTDLSQNIITDSVISEKELKFVNTETNYEILKDANKLKVGNDIIDIDKIVVNNDYIFAYLKEDVKEEAVSYPNKLEAISDEYTAVDLSDEFWIAGVKRDEPIVLFDNKYDFQNLKYLKTENYVVEVDSVIEHESYVWVKLKDEDKIRYFGYPNRIKFVYE